MTVGHMQMYMNSAVSRRYDKLKLLSAQNVETSQVLNHLPVLQAVFADNTVRIAINLWQMPNPLGPPRVCPAKTCWQISQAGGLLQLQLSFFDTHVGMV